MARLIDADALNIYNISPADGFMVMGTTEEDIALAPTIDAVSVVRCKDCKYLEQRVRFGNYPSEERENFCSYLWKFDFKDDDFCSYGERETEHE